jgi:hypothetical protein
MIKTHLAIFCQRFVAAYFIATDIHGNSGDAEYGHGQQACAVVQL